MLLRARFRRWCHQIIRFLRFWRWRTEPPCRAVSIYRTLPHASSWYLAVVACECGIEFGHA